MKGKMSRIPIKQSTRSGIVDNFRGYSYQNANDHANTDAS